MSLEQIKSVAENFISDTRNELLVIKGKWGAGKTFVWQKLIKEHKNKGSIGRIYYSYVSLFGINSLEELKNTILVSRVESNAKDVGEKVDRLVANFKQLVKSLEKIPKLQQYTGGIVSNLLYHSLGV